MAITDEDIIAVSEAIEGTTDDEVEALGEHLNRDPTDEEIDKLQLHLGDYVFKCEGCDWWCELSELNSKSYDSGELLCEDCVDL